MTDPERISRYKRAQQFAVETKTWSAAKLRAAYAQPKHVRQAEERARKEIMTEART